MELPRIPPELLGRLRAEPLRAPEIIALAAADAHGPSAAAWVHGLRSRYDIGDDELARKAKARHAALARFGGAATGVGGIVTFLPDLATLLWIQSRLVFYVAAAYGHDPTDPLRPAELLVIRDLYPTVPEARAALDGTGRLLAHAYVDKSLRGDREDAALVSSLMRFAGKRTMRRLAARAIPGIAVLFNAVSNERDTRALADRTIEFYRPR